MDPAPITVELHGGGGEAELARAAGLELRSSTAAGDYRRDGGRPVIGIDVASAAHPARLIATIAHELAHHRLDERGLDRDRADHEPLADLLTVHLGLGIFTANAAFEYRADQRRRSTHRLGYLTEPMFGYALACHAWLREETRPGLGLPRRRQPEIGPQTRPAPPGPPRPGRPPPTGRPKPVGLTVTGADGRRHPAASVAAELIVPLPPRGSVATAFGSRGCCADLQLGGPEVEHLRRTAARSASP